MSYLSFLHHNYRLAYNILLTVFGVLSWQIIRNLPMRHIPVHLYSVKRCNCYMVCAGEATGLSQSRRSSGLEIGCLIDTATGLLTFTSSGVEMATFFQVGHTGIH